MLLRVRVDSSPAHLVNKKTEFVVAASMDGVGGVAHHIRMHTVKMKKSSLEVGYLQGSNWSIFTST